MISTELTKPPPVQASDEPHTGAEFVGSEGFRYCRNCKKYHPKEYFVDRGKGVLACRRCNEAMIGVDHEKKVREGLRHIVSVFIDQEPWRGIDTSLSRAR